MKQRRLVILGITVPVITIILSLFFITGVFCKNSAAGSFGSSGASPLRNDSTIADAVRSQDVFRKVFEMNKNSVVFISTEQTVKVQRNPFMDDPFFRQFFGPDSQQPKTQRRTGLGTGFVISEDGYVCTNHHVVNGVDKVKVKIDAESYDATIVGSDEKTDLALLKLDSKKKFTPVFFGDSDKVQVGDWAIAIGNPFGLDRSFTVGVISATARRDLDFMGGSQTHIQTDASINPGNSGGPLLNIYGEVVGINRMIYSQSGGNVGIGFAIPVNTAKSVLEQLKTHKKIKRGYIGVQIVPLTEDYAKEIGLKNAEGALVGGVAEDSPAAKAGVVAGDVIISVDDKEVKNFGDLLSKVESTPIGKSLKVQIWRDKSKLNLYITVKERP